MMIYLYKEYNDELPYETELIQVFADKDRALAHWKAVITEQFGEEFDPKNETWTIDYYAGMELSEDEGYAKYWFHNGDSTEYWIVEPLVVC